MVDGVAATDLMSVMFGDDTTARRPAGELGGPAPEPSDVELSCARLRPGASSPAGQCERCGARCARRCELAARTVGEIAQRRRPQRSRMRPSQRPR